jgi:hypothetical protein
MEPQQTPHGAVAFRFASELIAGNFAGAHELLASARSGGELH